MVSSIYSKKILTKNLNLTMEDLLFVDRNGDGKYGIYVNYGGPTRFYELKTDKYLM